MCIWQKCLWGILVAIATTQAILRLFSGDIAYEYMLVASTILIYAATDLESPE